MEIKDETLTYIEKFEKVAALYTEMRGNLMYMLGHVHDVYKACGKIENGILKGFSFNNDKTMIAMRNEVDTEYTQMYQIPFEYIYKPINEIYEILKEDQKNDPEYAEFERLKKKFS